jgi:hypothetical protein
MIACETVAAILLMGTEHGRTRNTRTTGLELQPEVGYQQQQ